MPLDCCRLLRISIRRGLVLAAAVAVLLFASHSHATVITNLQQLTRSLSSRAQLSATLDLEVIVCAASRPESGAVIAQDATGTELLLFSDLRQELRSGERIRIRRDSVWLRKREMGVELSAVPVIENDGLHPWTMKTATTYLRAGKIPMRVEWFNYWRNLGLEVYWATSSQPQALIPASHLSHAVGAADGTTHFQPGLNVECYEGSWETVPDFNLHAPVKTGVATQLDLNQRSREERVGLRFTGFLDVPHDGQYQFSMGSDDGSLLFLGDTEIPVERLEQTAVPLAKSTSILGAEFKNLQERRWTAVEGRVHFVSRAGRSLRFDLGGDRHVISALLVDASDINPETLLNARIRVTGVGRGVLTADGSVVLGKLFVVSPDSLVFLDSARQPGEPATPITSVAEVQGLPIELARKSLRVRIRGTVTGAVNTTQERWMSFQDDTRGIFVHFFGVTNAAPALGEFWEVEGHSGAGDFAPIVIAEKLTRLGEGLLPAPARPTWAELLNGSRDVQWTELKGLVTDVHGNTITLHLPEGRLEVELDGLFEADLKSFVKDVVRIRGVLYAVWDAATREVRVGRVMMRSPTISVDIPAPADPFDAVCRTPRELLLFDAQASAFRPVKVLGQIVYADATQLFLQADGSGLRLLPTGKTDVRPGDLVEVVGYPSISRSELVLREALLRRTGTAALPAPKDIAEADFSQENLNATRVRANGKLLGWHAEETGPVLEMQSDTRLFLARIASGNGAAPSLRPGSRLALEGVYVGRGPSQSPNIDSEAFELLLNSLADITVLSQPPWWTLPRLLALLGVLLVILIFTVVWNTQLRRQVEQRTNQLQHEIRERERLERHAALESERSRIARDLHDDLGSSLTEISVLASTGQLPQANPTEHPNLFQAIGNRARSLISALDVIVWAVDPEDNSLQSLADYLTGYTNDFFSHTGISCRFKVPVSCPAITLEGRVRHDLLMVVKEALNNIVRHADATEVEFRLAVADGVLEIDISDNGKGINGDAPSGHGLKNLSSRLKNLGGLGTVEPRSGGGTIVKIRLPLGANTTAPIIQSTSA